MDKFEASILDGSAFRGPRTPSPSRSASTASPSPSPSSSSSSSPQSSHVPLRSSGPQTGPKGVLADQKYSARLKDEKRRDELRKTRQRLQKLALVGGTSEEQEKLQRKEKKLREKANDRETGGGAGTDIFQDGSEAEGRDRQEEEEEEEVLRRYRARRLAELKGGGEIEDAATSTGNGKLGGWQHAVSGRAHFGHLREVDERGYVKAVEGRGDGDHEAEAVVVHIYSKLVPASNQLTAALTSLARLHPSTKFLQIRALDIGFGLVSSSTADSDSDQEDLPESEYRLRQLEKEETISDVLPTLLIYKQGRLVGNLVRVDLEEDWREGSESDVATILRRSAAI